MNAQDFIERVNGCKTTLDLERLIQSWFAVADADAERERARAAWIQRWDDLSKRNGIVLAGKMT